VTDVIAWPARVKPPAGLPWSVTDDDRRQQTPESKTILAYRRASKNKTMLYSYFCERMFIDVTEQYSEILLLFQSLLSLCYQMTRKCDHCTAMQELS